MDAATALTTHEDLLIAIIGTGCKNFLYRDEKLVEESDYEHDIHVSSTEEQSKLALSADGSRLIVASDSGPIRVLKYPDCEPLTIVRLHTQGVNDVDVAKDGNIVATSARDNCTYIWNTDTGENVQLLEPQYKDMHRTSIKAVRFSPVQPDMLFAVESNPRKGGTWLSAWRKSTDIKISWQCQSHIHALKEGVSSFAVSPSGKHVAVASVEGHVAVLSWNGSSFKKHWNTEDGGTLFSPAKSSHALPVTSVCFTQSSQYLLTASADWTVAVWSVRKRTNFKRIFKWIRFAWFSVLIVAITIALSIAEGDPLRLGPERVSKVKRLRDRAEQSCMKSATCRRSRSKFDTISARGINEASDRLSQVYEVCDLEEPEQSLDSKPNAREVVLYRLAKPACRNTRDAFRKASEWKVQLHSKGQDLYRRHGPIVWETIDKAVKTANQKYQATKAHLAKSTADSSNARIERNRKRDEAAVGDVDKVRIPETAGVDHNSDLKEPPSVIDFEPKRLWDGDEPRAKKVTVSDEMEIDIGSNHNIATAMRDSQVRQADVRKHVRSEQERDTVENEEVEATKYSSTVTSSSIDEVISKAQGENTLSKDESRRAAVHGNSAPAESAKANEVNASERRTQQKGIVSSVPSSSNEVISKSEGEASPANDEARQKTVGGNAAPVDIAKANKVDTAEQPSQQIGIVQDNSNSNKVASSSPEEDSVRVNSKQQADVKLPESGTLSPAHAKASQDEGGPKNSGSTMDPRVSPESRQDIPSNDNPFSNTKQDMQETEIDDSSKESENFEEDKDLDHDAGAIEVESEASIVSGHSCQRQRIPFFNAMENGIETP